jgi:DegV family protein with EDD domain
VAGLVAVVTDSSASVDPAWTGARALTVVPLRLLAGDAVADDLAGPPPAIIAAALRQGARLTTAGPPPERLAAAYGAAAAAGAPAVVSVHLSGALSGTADAARLAASTAPLPVRVVDSRSIGAGLGLTVRAALAAAAGGADADGVAAAAERTAAGVASYFALDSSVPLRAGGRLSAPASGPAPSSATAGEWAAGLRSRPLLHIAGGRVEILERVRTRGAARDRLTELAADAVARLGPAAQADAVIQHTGAPGEALRLRDQLAALPLAGPVAVLTAGLAIQAHAGPGLLAVAVAPAGL